MSSTIPGGSADVDGGPVAKAAHVNMMVDTIIANIPAEGLRSVMRGVLASDTSFTSVFLQQSQRYLDQTKLMRIPQLFTSQTPSPAPTTTPEFEPVIRRARCLMGCGRGFESLKLLTEIVLQATALDLRDSDEYGEVLDTLAEVDGDIVQCFTAIEKEFPASKAREMTAEEKQLDSDMLKALEACRAKSVAADVDFPFERGLGCLESADFRS